MTAHPHRPEPSDHAALPLTVAALPLWPGVALLRAQGELTPTTATALLDPLDDEFAKDPWALVLDLSTVSALHSASVPTLVDIARRAATADIGLYLLVSGTGDAVVPAALDAAGALALFELHTDLDGVVSGMPFDDVLSDALGGRP